MGVSQKIQVRRGTKANLPALDVGEPALTTDTKELFFGAAGGNIELASILSGGFKIQSGYSSLTTMTQNAWVNNTVTFPTPFSTAPIVIATNNQGGYRFFLNVTGTTTTNFSIQTNNMDVAVIGVIHWVAIGS